MVTPDTGAGGAASDQASTPGPSRRTQAAAGGTERWIRMTHGPDLLGTAGTVCLIAWAGSESEQAGHEVGRSRGGEVAGRPHWVAPAIPLMYQVPFDERKTAKSVVPSPS